MIQPNVLVCLTQQAYNTFFPIIRPGGLLLTDTRFVKTERKVGARQMAAAIPDSKLIIIPESTHFVPLEKPLEVNKAILNFLND